MTASFSADSPFLSYSIHRFARHPFHAPPLILPPGTANTEVLTSSMADLCLPPCASLTMPKAQSALISRSPGIIKSGYVSISAKNTRKNPFSNSRYPKMFSACGISRHFWLIQVSRSASLSFSSRIFSANHFTACFPASTPALIPTLVSVYFRISFCPAITAPLKQHFRQLRIPKSSPKAQQISREWGLLSAAQAEYSIHFSQCVLIFRKSESSIPR